MAVGSEMRASARVSRFEAVVLALGLCACACSSSRERSDAPDGGARDAGRRDGGDAGASGRDSGPPDAASTTASCEQSATGAPLLGIASAALTGAPPLALREGAQLTGEGLALTLAPQQNLAPGLRWQRDRLFLLADRGFWDISEEDGARWYDTASVLLLAARAADLDADGDQDLLLLSGEVNPDVAADPRASPLVTRLAAWERTPQGLSERSDVMSLPYVILPIPYEAGDVDGDGDLDIVHYEHGAPVGYLHDGAFGFTRTVLGQTAAQYEDKLMAFVYFADRNQDGAGDLVVVTGEALEISVFVLLADGSGGFGAPGPATTMEAPLAPHGPNGIGFWLGDVTGDGLADVVAQDADRAKPLLNVFASEDATHLAPAVQLAGLGFEFADVDADGKTDLVTTRDEGLTALLSRGDGAFEARGLGVHTGAPVTDFAVDPGGSGEPTVHLLYDLSSCPACTDRCAGRCLFGACAP